MHNLTETLAERGSRYRKYAEHARITQQIQYTLQTGKSWQRATDSQKEALEMIAHILGRIVNGDPHYHDSWHDIAEYATLVSEQLKANERPATSTF